MESSPVVTPPYVAGPLRLHPFRAWMLAPSRVGDPATTRILARRPRGTTDRWDQWVEGGVLRRDRGPALYLHEYTAGGVTIRGLVGTLEVARRAEGAADAVVLPHEGIHPPQADDLADRMDALRINPAPILLVHRATPSLRGLLDNVRRQQPERTFTDHAGQHHRVWAIRAPQTHRGLNDAMTGARALLADGHHRYAAYLRLQQRHPGGPEDRGLAMLVDHDDTPLFLGAIHRVLEGVDLQDLRTAALAARIEVRDLASENALAALGPTTILASDGTAWCALTPSMTAHRAVVEVLHEDLIPLLARGPARIQHLHGVGEALSRAQRHRTAVLLPAPSVDSVIDIVSRDRLLPEKATSFQPKPSLGVLVRSLHDG